MRAGTKILMPAELVRGAVLGLDLSGPAAVAEQGGVISGTPTFLREGGVVLNGTTEYLTYALNGREFNSAETSIVIEITPDFATDENVERYLVDDNLANYRVLKRNNAGDNELRLFLGGTFIADIAEATYSPFWLVGQRNVITIYGTSSDTSVDLNGNNILSGDATAWTPTAPTSLFIGARNDGTSLFDGTIHSFKVWHALLTQDEAQAYYGNKMFSFENDAVLNLPMLASDHDPTGVKTLDRSGNSNDATFGDGSTPSTYPTKLSRRGYGFDGGDYMTTSISGQFNTDALTFAMLFSPDFDTDENVLRFLFYTTFPGTGMGVQKNNNAASNTLAIVLGNTTIALIPEATYGPYWRVGQVNVIVVTGDSVSNLTNVWLNGVRILADDTTAWSPVDPATLHIGARSDGNRFDGDFHNFEVYPFALNETQVIDATLRLQREAMKVA